MSLQGPEELATLVSDHSSPSGASGQTGGPGAPRTFKSRRALIWLRFVPFVMSAVFFLTGVLAVFAPLPLLLVSFQSGRKWAWPAILTNAALVYMLAGPVSLAFYVVFALVIALVLPELLLRRKSLELTALGCLIAMLATAALGLGAYAFTHHVQPLHEVKQQVSSFIDALSGTLSPEAKKSLMGDDDPDQWKAAVMSELPSAVLIFSLLMVWANLVSVLKLNPRGIRERLGLDANALKRWKAPEILLWPTIVSGALLLRDFGWPSAVALNFFKCFMAVYALAGLSLLSFIFETWKIRGILRALGFIAAVVLMMPLVLSLGFFDQWFDFRSKLRQS